MKKKTAKLLIIGGGFAGIKLIRALRYETNIDVTLISDDDDFRYCPALYRTATGHKHRESCIPIKSLIAGMQNVTFVRARAEKINRKNRVVTAKGGQKFRYDYCVIAVGVVTSYFGIPGLEKYSYGIKSAAEIDKLRCHLHQALTDENAVDKNYIVVGAGPTGVELSAALSSYLTKIAKKHKVRRSKVNIELIEAADRVLPVLAGRASALAAKRLKSLGVKVMTGKKVEAETEKTLVVDGRSIPTHTVIWTAGVTNNPFFAANGDQFTLNERKKVVVDDHLRVDEHTFVIGDNAATQYSGLALTAVLNALYVARFIKHQLNGKTILPYRPFKPISVVPVGENHAIAQWGKLTFDGRLGGLLRMFADLIGYADVMSLRKALSIWLRRNEIEENCDTCRVATMNLEDQTA